MATGLLLVGVTTKGGIGGGGFDVDNSGGGRGRGGSLSSSIFSVSAK